MRCISRRPLREALKVLASEGWVSLAPGMGAFVTALGPQDIDELFPVMALLEGRCACDAVRRLTAAEARRLATLHERLERLAAAGDIDGYYAVNVEFHRAIESLAGNPLADPRDLGAARVPDDVAGPAAEGTRPPARIAARTPAADGRDRAARRRGRRAGDACPSACAAACLAQVACCRARRPGCRRACGVRCVHAGRHVRPGPHPEAAPDRAGRLRAAPFQPRRRQRPPSIPTPKRTRDARRDPQSPTRPVVPR